MKKLGLKLGSQNTQFTEEILRYYDEGVFQYIELFVPSGTYEETIPYWVDLAKSRPIPFGIHAPHSAAGLNLANSLAREQNRAKIEESMRFADSLKADYIVFHSGTNGLCGEVIKQLRPYTDSRLLIENKPVRGLDGSSCVGSTLSQLQYIISELNAGFCLDFGHAICAANTLKKEPFGFIKGLLSLKPRLYHLTDGDYKSELDSHLHYGAGSFPLKELLSLVPDGGQVTNEAKRSDGGSLKEFCADSKNIVQYL